MKMPQYNIPELIQSVFIKLNTDPGTESGFNITHTYNCCYTGVSKTAKLWVIF